MENVKQEEINKNIKPSYKVEECKVIDYNSKTKELDVNFKGFGIRLINIKEFNGEIANIKYTSEIGKANFTYELSK